MKTLLISILSFYLFTQPNTTNLSININDIDKVGEGQIRVFLWDHSEGFPSKIENARYKGTISEFGETATYQFEGIPYGDYAVSVHQDKNKNDEMDTNFLGIPKEPVGAYNMKGIGKPKFKKSIVTLNQPTHQLSIKMMND
ncbi:MAG: DUF2141 domain-containing protein [Bacteroidota bacterium]